MKDMIYITGHKNPDSDSICSAIAYADFKNKTTNVTAIPVRLGQLSSETQFILDYFNVDAPTLIKTVKPECAEDKKKVILVDHNETSQSIDGLDEAELIEVIDHHKIGDVQTGSPIYFRNEPVGCTATIIASRFFENDLTPSKEVAGLLCGAIISDTLLLKSPTATEKDRKILEKLSKIAEIDLETFANEMFIAGTSLVGKTSEEIFNQDFKAFNMGNFKVGIAQVNTMDIAGFKSMEASVLNYMEEKAEKESFNIIILMLTDIIKEGSALLVVGKDKDMVPKVFNVENLGTDVFIPGIVSRKKQVVPPLTAALS